MVSFVISLVALVLGYLLYGKFVAHVFGPDDRPTPSLIVEGAPSTRSLASFKPRPQASLTALAFGISLINVVIGLIVVLCSKKKTPNELEKKN